MSQNDVFNAPPSEEELGQAKLFAAPPSEEEMGQVKLFAQPPSKEEIDLLAEHNLSGHRSNQVAEGSLGLPFTDKKAKLSAPGRGGEVTANQAAVSAITGAQSFYDKDNGFLENAFYTLSGLEQVAARQVINLLENTGAMTTDEARELLIRDQVHASDIVNFYWKDPQNVGGKIARFGVGLAADILLDPLSYVGVGALTHAAKSATIAGKTISGLGKMSKVERNLYKSLEGVEKIIKNDGALHSAVEGLEDVAKTNEMLIAKTRDDLAKQFSSGPLGMNDINQSLDQMTGHLNVSESTKEAILKHINVGMTEKSWVKEWYEGSRGLTFGARIPFTNTGFEVDMPGHLSKMAAFPFLTVDAAFGVAGSVVKAAGMDPNSLNIVKKLATNTGKLFVDLQLDSNLGQKTALREGLGQFSAKQKEMLVYKQKALGPDRYAQLHDDIIEELDNGLHTEEAARALAEQYKVTDEELIKHLYTPTIGDSQRASRLAEHPEVADFIEEARAMMREKAEAYKSRNLAFSELNPFGKGWARQYIKHDVTRGFLDKMKEIKDADDVIGHALASTPELLGKVDDSAKGRRYRGPLREANAKMLEKHGVKMFVDDPIELITRRIEEMDKVIRDHDLLASTIPYAVKGKNPGAGYVKFNPDHLKRLSIDLSDQFAVKWDMYVPDFFKTSDHFEKRGKFVKEGTIATEQLMSPEGVALVDRKVRAESIYLPEDVMDRVLHEINGWDVDRPMSKILHAADFYTTVWRNNALFGAGYVGLNAFSNALTYLSMNDAGGAGALAKATALLLPTTMAGRALDKVGGVASGAAKSFKVRVGVDEAGEAIYAGKDEVLRMAMEDNVLGSSFTQIEFGDLAEHVASNREARKTMGQKVMTVADKAFLWRYSKGLAQSADEIPKLATYISRLEAGFSRKGAAEAAERYFYNFNKVSKYQDVARKTIPFSAFPIKTMEMVVEQLKTGNLAGLALPGKVQAALDGAFVQDHEVRAALDQNLPSYRNLLHPIHGELMPGMREVMIDVPWSYTTFGTVFNAEDTQHPIAQLFWLLGAGKTKAEEIMGIATEQQSEEMAEQGKKFKNLVNANLDMIIPSYVRETLALAEINGALDLGGFFRDRYTTSIPTNQQFERYLSDRQEQDKGTAVQRFTNAAEFGQAMDEKYGQDWLYNLVFRNRIDDDSLASMEEQGVRGEYVRRKMRQFSLGLAHMTKLDSNFFANRFAITRQLQFKERSLKEQIARSGMLLDTERISEPEFLAKQSETFPLAKEVLSLHYKRDALEEYYNFFLEAEKKAPTVDLIELIVGAGKHDYSDKPDSDVYESLFRRKTRSEITDEDAEEYMGIIQMEEP